VHTLVFIAGLGADEPQYFLPPYHALATYFDTDTASYPAFVPLVLMTTALLQSSSARSREPLRAKPYSLSGPPHCYLPTVGCLLAPIVEFSCLFWRMCKPSWREASSLSRAPCAIWSDPSKAASMDSGYVTMACRGPMLPDAGTARWNFALVAGRLFC